MNLLEDQRTIERLRKKQQGVFSTADLKTALAERHSAAFTRRVAALLEHAVLRRFIRGFYVADPFDLATLSQRIAPASCISFDTVLARSLLIGPRPTRRITATKVGPGRHYRAHGHEIIHLSIAPHLHFGWMIEDGLRIAHPEKAILDTLYFHLRGRHETFDIYSDLHLEGLDPERLNRYLQSYRNPRFVRFARNVLSLP